jgi:hypothetical protein
VVIERDDVEGESGKRRGCNVPARVVSGRRSGNALVEAGKVTDRGLVI